MSYRYLDSEFNSVQTEEESTYLNIECYDIVELVETIISKGCNYKVNTSSDFYPRYFPPRYMMTLEKNTEKNTDKDLSKVQGNIDKTVKVSKVNKDKVKIQEV